MCNVKGTSSTASTGPLTPFEQAPCKKTDKVYTATPNIQPLRQINLPDTHIFTPTDSEIPRSKTIHYDTGTAVPAPQTIAHDSEDEYSDFQDFSASSSLPKPSPAKEITKTEQNVSSQEALAIHFQTSMLQPIKLGAPTPTLNWPGPGQVKETFEDFSDFISSTPCQEKQKTAPSHQNTRDTKIKDDAKIVSERNSTEASVYDDDFDTFQSAAAISSNQKDIQCLSLPSHTLNSIDSLPSTTIKNTPDIDASFSAFAAVSGDKSQTNISLNQAGTPPSSQSLTPINFISITEASQLPPNKQTSQTASPLAGTRMNPQVLQPTRLSTQSLPANGQILQPLSLESYSQINWPNPGDTLDLSDLSRFNPVETLPSLKSESNVSNSKTASPAHSHKSKISEDDWGDFVSSEPKQSPQSPQAGFVDNDEWTDFFSCTQPHNGLNTISLNVHTNHNIQKTANQTKHNKATNQIPLEIPKLNYVTPKTNHHRTFSDRHFQNL